MQKAATTLAGAIGAILGAGLGAIIRDLDGAVTTAVLVLFVIPPLTVQAISERGPWIPPALFAVISGVGSDVSLWAALNAITAWSSFPRPLASSRSRDETSCDASRPCRAALRVGTFDPDRAKKSHLAS